MLQDKRFKNRELQIMKMMGHPNVVDLKHCFYTTTDKDEVHLSPPLLAPCLAQSRTRTRPYLARRPIRAHPACLTLFETDIMRYYTPRILPDLIRGFCPPKGSFKKPVWLCPEATASCCPHRQQPPLPPQ